jgi:acetylornithine deacetylase/succinyl-diaminopimelate desuccinylase-like protein
VTDPVLREEIAAAVDALRDELVVALSELVAVPSIAPLRIGDRALSGSPGGEAQATLRFQELLEDAGARTELVTAAEGRPNLGARVAGTGGGPSLALVGHVDVVPPGPQEGWTVTDPWRALERDGLVYGRGTADMKGGDLCAVFACRALRELSVRLSGDLVVALAVGEEVMDTVAGIGALLDAGYGADAAVVMEPTRLPGGRVGLGLRSRGQLVLRIEVAGLPVHLSYRGLPAGFPRGFEAGVSAIEKALVIERALEELDERWGRRAAGDDWRPTLYLLAIDGGTSMQATVPERCGMWYVCYCPPEHRPDEVEAEVRSVVSRAAEQDPWLARHPPRVERALWWPGFSTGSDAPVAKVVAGALGAAEGRAPEQVGAGYVCDASFVRARGTDTVLLGPGEIRVAHGFDEFVAVEDLLSMTKAYALAAVAWCGRS